MMKIFGSMVSRVFQRISDMRLVTIIIISLMYSSNINHSYADDTFLPFPYFTDFEKHEDDEDEEDDEHSKHYHDDNEIEPEEDWKTKGLWKMSKDHNTWLSYSGKWHMDANHEEKTISDQGEEEKKYYAKLKHYITIPIDDLSPVINFWQVMQLNSVNDSATVEIKVLPATTEEDLEKDKEWTTVKTYTSIDNSSVYSAQTISLSAYLGQSIKIRFTLHVNQDSGIPAWLIDDVLVGYIADIDGDGATDVLDLDRDGDLISNDYELLVGTNPDDPNNYPPDLDKDGIPDSLDDDRDGDGVLNVDDVFPDDVTEWSDIDGDGLGDNIDPDRDADGINDIYEVAVGTDQNDPTSTPPDQDADGIPDSIDDDRDGDGVANIDDPFPDDATEWSDIDADGIGDNTDLDIDGDGIDNDYEIQVGTDPNDPKSTPPDFDLDGIPDSLDLDLDGDGVDNLVDLFPTDPLDWADLDGDGVGDNADSDTDGDGINNDFEILVGTDPRDVNSTPPDLDNDGIPNSLDSDRDGDTVANIIDAYPDDGSRSKLSAVTNVIVTLVDTQVNIDWAAYPDANFITGYNIYRQTFGAVEALLTSLPKTATNYLDTSVVNATGYSYRIVAIDIRGNEGAPGTAVDFFVAYNLTTVSGISATREAVDARLNWTAVTGMQYQVYRGTSTADIIALQQVSSPTFLDNIALWDQTYVYQVATIANFTDVFTSLIVSVVGPVTVPITLNTVPVLGLSIQNSRTQTDGSVQLTVEDAQRVAINGNFTQAIGPVDISITDTVGAGQTFNAVSGDGQFSFILPATVLSWTVTVSEQTVANRSVTLALNLIVDNIAPTISIDGAAQRTVDADTIVITGTVTDTAATIAEVYASTNRFSQQQFAALLAGDNTFSIELPLEPGDNNLTVFATDSQGNTGTSNITVTSSVSAAPQVRISSPSNGDTLYTNSTTVTGIVYSSLPADQIKIALGTIEQFPTTTAVNGEYPFTFDAVNLVEGYNTLTIRAGTPVGSAEKSVLVNYNTKQPTVDNTSAPVISLSAPSSNYLNNTSVVVAGSITSEVSIVSLSLNGTAINLTGSANTLKSFQHAVDLTAVVDTSLVITLIATDSLGQTSQLILNLVNDAQSPVIGVTNPELVAAPASNAIIETPYTLNGTVADSNLSSFTVNGQDVGLLPGALPGEYKFSVALALIQGLAQTVTLQARDKSGNVSSQDWLFDVNLPVQIEVITPKQNSQLLSTTAGISIDVVVRLTGQAVDDSVHTSIDAEPYQAMLIDGNVASTQLQTILNDGEHKINIEVRDVSGSAISKTTVLVNLNNADNIPLEVDRSEPANSASFVETNAAINVYFTRAIDPTLLQITVKETVHGRGYDLSSQVGAALTELQTPKLVAINHDMAPVAGSLSHYPGNRYVTFNPAIRYAYNADLYVTVSYNNVEINRFNFKTKPLPTLISGRVTDQFGTPVTGINVEVAELGLSSITNDKGNYLITSGKTTKTITGGRYTLSVNPKRDIASFGVIDIWANIEAGELNTTPLVTLPILSRNTAFVRINSGQGNVRLARGNLVLDMTQANLRFPDQRSNGDIHVQFTSLAELSFKPSKSAIPYWMYAVQPTGIQVSGTVAVTINMPSLYGSDSYIPADGSLVMMLAFNSETKNIEPIGVGRVSNKQVVSAQPLAITNLDYFGYAIMDSAGQLVLQRYLNGEITQLTQLITELETVFDSGN